MSLQQILTPSIHKAVQTLFDVTLDKVEFQATRKEFEGRSQERDFRQT